MKKLGKYELHEQLGKGGFGTVYRAIDTSLNREVALKVLHPQLMVDDTFVERFKKEAFLLASLEHPNIVTIYELGEADGRLFIAMQYLAGGSLQKLLAERGALPFERAREIMEQVCAGLQSAHAKGLVHRDIKPANILFDKSGRAVVSDFGLARAVQISGTSSSLGMAGTPAYRAPELWRGKPPAGPATDVYSLGCVFYEMLTGRLLFGGDTPDEILARHLIDGPDLPDQLPKDAPSGVWAVLEKAVAREQGERYQTVEAFAAALEGCARPVSTVKEAPVKSKGKLSAGSAAAGPPKPSDSGGEETPKDWPLKKIGMIAGAAAALGLVVWLAVQGGEKGDGPSPTDAPTTAASAQARESEVVPSPTPALTSMAASASSAEPTLARTPETPAEETLGIGSTQISKIDGMEMVYVPAGDFLMGSTEGEGNDNEHPQHTVFLDAYWIDKTEVTNAMYEKCVADGACAPPENNSSETRSSYYDNDGFADYPVIYVDWNQAKEYCEWADRSLPTEAQWEKAARGPDGRTYPWGNGSPDDSLANSGAIKDDTNKVGSYPAGASPYGAVDMAGNVWEWVGDWYESDYYQTSPSTNPEGPGTGLARILRGGSWYNSADGIRSALRFWYLQSSADHDRGFRCAVTIPQS